MSVFISSSAMRSPSKTGLLLVRICEVVLRQRRGCPSGRVRGSFVSSVGSYHGTVFFLFCMLGFLFLGLGFESFALFVRPDLLPLVRVRG